MSAKKKTRGDATAIAHAAFAEAIDSCTVAWRERWKRAPTVGEMIDAFDTCVSANPDEYVEDVGPVLAMTTPAPARAPIAISDFNIAFHTEQPEAEIYLRAKGLLKPWAGEVQTYLELVGETLVVDVFFEECRKVKTFEEATALVRAFVLEPYIARKQASVTRVVLRPMSGLADPVTLPWSSNP